MQQPSLQTIMWSDDEGMEEEKVAERAAFVLEKDIDDSLSSMQADRADAEDDNADEEGIDINDVTGPANPADYKTRGGKVMSSGDKNKRKRKKRKKNHILGVFLKKCATLVKRSLLEIDAGCTRLHLVVDLIFESFVVDIVFYSSNDDCIHNNS